MADIKTLKVFRTVAACGSFHAAAEEMNISVSAISMQIRDLEDYAGCLLFDRGRKPPPLTEEGRAFLKKVEDVLMAWDGLAGSKIASQQSGRLRIGAVHTCLSSFLPSALKTLREHYPHLDVTVHLGHSDDLEADLLAGRIDFALLTMPSKQNGDLNYHHVIDEPLVLIKSAHQHGDNAFDCLANNPIVRFNPKARVGRLIDDIMTETLGHTAQERGAMMEIDALESIQALVKEGLGVAIVPLVIGVDLPEGIIAIPFKEDHKRPLSFVAPRTGRRIEMTTDILELICDAAQQLASK